MLDIQCCLIVWSGLRKTPNHCCTTSDEHVAAKTVPNHPEYCSSSDLQAWFRLSSCWTKITPHFSQVGGSCLSCLYDENCCAMTESQTIQYSANNGGSCFRPWIRNCRGANVVCGTGLWRNFVPLLTKNLAKQFAISLHSSTGYSDCPVFGNFGPFGPIEGFQESCVCEPSHCLQMASYNEAVALIVVHLSILLPYIQAWDLLSRRDSHTCCIRGCCRAHICMIAHKYELRWFFTLTEAPRQTSMQIRHSVNAYRLLAAATLLESKSFRPETPGNWDGDRSGSALIISIPFGKGRSLAFDDVPPSLCWHGLPCPTKHPHHCPL